jgi:hypothetical protein
MIAALRRRTLAPLPERVTRSSAARPGRIIVKHILRHLVPALGLALLAACGGGGDASPTSDTSTPPDSGGSASTVNTATAITGTSAYGVLGTATARIAFVPSGQGVVPILLESSGTATISSNRTQAMSAIAGAAPSVPLVPFSFPVDACMIDSNDAKGVCIGFASSKVGVMDLTTFATTLHVADIGVTEFDSGAGTVANSYSGGSCILCAVAGDIGKHRFVIGGAGGFRVFSYGSTAASALYDIPVGENFAFLPQPAGSSYIIAPEYEPNGGQRKLRVVNVDTAKTYVWTKNTDSVADLGAAGAIFESSEVDAAAVDINTKMIAMSAESGGDFLLVDFGQATFDETALTFSAPFAIAAPNPATSVSRLTAVANSTQGSILLSHGEADSNIGVVQLPTSAGNSGTFTGVAGPLGVFDLNDAGFDRTPCGASYRFSGKFDPHGLGLYAGLDNGQRGLIVDSSNSCAALIDLAGMIAAAHSASDPNQIDTSLPSVAALVVFVKLN